MLRWRAIEGTPIEEFLRGLNKKVLSLLELNMFLAEDRIMCFKIISQNLQTQSYELMYLPGARAVTDPPQNLLRLIQQRRRWINGANAIFVFVTLKCLHMTETKHSKCQKSFFIINFVISLLSQIMGFVSTGLFYGTISSFIRFFVQNKVEDIKIDTPFQMASIFENLILLSYMVLVIISLGMGKGLDNPKVQWTLIGISVILCGFNFFVVIYTLAGLFSSALTILILIGFLFTYFIPPMLYECKLFCKTLPKQLLSILAYLLCMPLYLIVFQVYSYANFHDVTWGNREASADMTLQQIQKRQQEILNEKLLKRDYKITRVFIFIVWIFMNLGTGYLMSQFRKQNMTSLLILVAYSLIIFQLLKLVGMLAYWIMLKRRDPLSPENATLQR